MEGLQCILSIMQSDDVRRTVQVTATPLPCNIVCLTSVRARDCLHFSLHSCVLYLTTMAYREERKRMTLNEV